MTAHHPATAPRPRLLPALDLLLAILAFTVAYFVRFGEPPFGGDVPHKVSHLLLGLGVLAAWVPALFLLDLYESSRFARPGRLLVRVAQAAVLVALAAAALLFLAQAKLASRLVLALTIGQAALLAWLARVALGRLLARHAVGLHVLVVGAGPEAARLARALEGAELLGFLRAGDADPRAHPVLGEAHELAQVLDREVVDHVIVAVEPAAWERVEEALLACAEVGVDASVSAPLPEAVLARAAPDRLFGVPVLRLDGSPQFRAAMAGKRAFDLVLTLLLLPLALPVLLLAALLVRLTSKGPVLYAQERVGLHGRRFRLYKLRTMVDGAEEQLPALAGRNEVRGPAFKLRKDPRVTPAGRFLRRFSLDELPQLGNVLKGEMSLVGPRPPLPEEVDRYDRWQRRRLSVRPGLTCIWQVSGRSELGFDEWMRLDLEYIDNWSPWLDLKILIKTLPAVVSGRGAR